MDILHLLGVFCGFSVDPCGQYVFFSIIEEIRV
jgi:hypothetical protein